MKTRLRALLSASGPLVAGLVVALVLRVLLFEPFTIPTGSMEPNLLVGDYVIASKGDYGWSRHSIPLAPPLFSGRLFARTAARGDIVVFRLPRDTRVTYVKRLIGLPGDTVQVKQGAVWLNGEPMARRLWGNMADPQRREAPVEVWRETTGTGRNYLTLDRGPGRIGDDTPPVRVPDGTYFFLGDNRDNSLDSRWATDVGVGFVPAELLVGRARLVLFSLRPDASFLRPWTWLRWDRFLHPV